jgi:hypothetical protein
MKSKPLIPQGRFLRAAIAEVREKSKRPCSEKVLRQHGRTLTFFETLLKRVERAAVKRK